MSEKFTTSQLTAHFGVGVPAALLIEKGIEPAERVKNGYNWSADSVPLIASVLADHLIEKGNQEIVPAPKVKKPKPEKAAKPVEHDPLNDDDEEDDEL